MADDDAPMVQTLAGSALPPPVAAGSIGPRLGSGSSTFVPRDLYRSPGRLITGLQIALVASIAAEAVELASSIRALGVVDRLEHRPQSVTVGQLDTIDRRSVVIGIVNVAVALLATGFLIALTRRLYRNVPALSNYPRRFSQGWAVGAWFVPILNFVRPKQIVDDIWRATAPDQPTWWSPSLTPVPKLVHIWWASLIASHVIGLVAAGSPDPASVADVRDGMEMDLVAGVTSIVFALLTMVVGLRLVARDRSRAESALGMTAPSPTATAPRLIGAMAVGIAALAAGLAAFAPDTSTRAEDGAAGVLADDLLVGDCVDFPADFEAAGSEVTSVVGVPLRPCGAPHDAEVIAEVRHPAGVDVAYPGDDAVFAVGGRLCLAQFERAVGSTYEESILDIAVFAPTRSWSLGDRTIQCLAYRMDGRTLDETVLGSGL